MKILVGDALEILDTLEPKTIDAMVTDPPAGIAFMGKAWDRDHGGRDEWVDMMGKIFEGCLRALKPGAHALVWALPRTAHWTTLALEDAGFDVRDVIVHVFGTGFPKSLNLNGEWSGFGTALKPASEHWILARVPFSGTVAANVLEHGTGALNVDGCRVGDIVETWPQSRSYHGPRGPKPRGAFGGGDGETQSAGDAPPGRWPPNLVLTHAHDCTDDTCAEGCPVADIDSQSGDMVSVRSMRGVGWNDSPIFRPSGRKDFDTERGYEDSGGASRFFPRFRYESKPSSAERNAGLEGMARLDGAAISGRKPGSLGLEWEGGSNAYAGATGGARENHHPTVKSIALMRWLCRLITPPGGTVLDPFTGSGTTGIAATREGFEFIGIEREPEYAELAIRRIEEDAPLFLRGTLEVKRNVEG